jgi:predicted nucleic acid-binding protein
MSVFVDTSAILAVLHADDANHGKAAATFRGMLDRGQALVTLNYCVIETVAIVQHRFGLRAVRSFHADLLPVMAVTWVDAEIHGESTMALLTGGA